MFKRGVASAIGLTCALAAQDARAQQVPVRHYTIDDGLAHGIVGAIYQDAKGYVWCATADGLSRFDGYRFKNYGPADGLGGAVVTAVTEDSHGQLWIGTTHGVARLIDDPAGEQAGPASPRSKFVLYEVGGTPESNGVSSLFFDSHGTIWCATDDIYRSDVDRNGQVHFAVAARRTPGWTTFTSLVDRRGRVWFGLYHEAFEIADARVIRYGESDGLPEDRSLSLIDRTIFSQQIVAMAEDHLGRVIAANRRELLAFDEPVHGERGRWRRLAIDLAPDLEIRSLLPDPDGWLWVGTTRGLLRVTADGRTTNAVSIAPTRAAVISLLADREGNVWAGTLGDGVFKVSPGFVLNYPSTLEQDTLRLSRGADGLIYQFGGGVITAIPRDGTRHVVASAPWPAQTATNAMACADGRRCWVATTNGLYRFDGAALDGYARALSVDLPRRENANAGQFVVTAYEDSQHRVWAGLRSERALYVISPDGTAASRMALDEQLGVPADKHLDILHAVTEDRRAGLWLAWQADIGRLRDGRITLFDRRSGLPMTLGRCLFVDSRGWLWIGLGGGGVSVTRDPAAAAPVFDTYSTATGLANDTVAAIAEDRAGRMYLATGKGLDRLDPATGHVRHLTSRDGLLGGLVEDCLTDDAGHIWISLQGGISRLTPRTADVDAPPPPVYVASIRAGGKPLALPETGANRTPEFTLPASRTDLVVEFVGLSFRGDGSVRYQSRLEPVDRAWSPPSEQPSVSYARLGPGAYRLLVRSVTPDGRVAADPAVVAFQVLPPYWQRWWFLIGVAGVVIAGALGFYRIRIRRFTELDRLRQQVARDLHDEVGSGLAQIAILTEVARRQSSQASLEWLGDVAQLARGLRESMSEIVWAVDPRHDQLTDVVERMRQAAFNLLEVNGVRVEFVMPEPRELARINLTSDRRRQILLLFKEAITNIARHAHASSVRVELSLQPRRLALTIDDDGRGFDPAGVVGGHGLHGLAQRAAELGGAFDLSSRPGSGTQVRLTLPL